MRKALATVLERIARRNVLRLPHVSVARSAKFDSRRILVYPTCKLSIGEGAIVEGRLVAERDGAEISIGRNTYIGNSLLACAKRIEVGDDVLISWGCNIVDHNSHSVLWEERCNDVRDRHQGSSAKDWTNVPVLPVKIHNKCWIGFNAIILKGVEIGEGAIVGAGSVITKSVEPWTIVAGNPAKFIRSNSPGDRRSLSHAAFL